MAGASTKDAGGGVNNQRPVQKVVDPLGPITELGVFITGRPNAYVRDINVTGFVVGGSSATTTFGQPLAAGDRGFGFEPISETTRVLSPLSGFDYSEGRGVNAVQGAIFPRIVGQSGNSSTGVVRATRWDFNLFTLSYVATNLGDLPGGADFSIANQINNANEIVGSSIGSNGQRAVYWAPGTTTPIDLGAFSVSVGQPFSEANSISETGLIVGSSLIDVTDEFGVPTGQVISAAFIYDTNAGSPEMIPLPPVEIGGTLAAVNRALGVNSSGVVVGSGSLTGGGQLNAFLWSPTRGTLNLNEHVNASGSGWTLLEARSVLETGHIVGLGLNPAGKLEGFLLDPINDPPVIDPIAPQNVDEGSLLSFTVTATDPDGDDLTFILGREVDGAFEPTLPPGGEGATIDPETGVFSWVPPQGPTVVEFAVLVHDDGAGFLSDWTTFEVTVDNVAPTADAGGPYTITVGESLDLMGIGTDPGVLDVLTFTWDVNGNGIFGDATGESPTLTWSELNALGITGPGQWNVTLRVADDGGGVTDSDPTTLTVVGAGPVAEIVGPAVAARGEPLEFTLNATGGDGGPFTFQIDWDGNGTFDQTVVGPSGTVVERIYPATGTFNVKVKATDTSGEGPVDDSHSIDVVRFRTAPDDVNPAVTNLIVGGSTGIDFYIFLPAGGSNILFFRSFDNSVLMSSFETIFGVTGRIITYAQGTLSNVIVGELLTNTPVEFHGSNGNDVLVGSRTGDTLIGGGGNDILIGGTATTDGGDLLIGTSGRNILMSHRGANTIMGGSGDDLIMAGTHNFPFLPVDIFSIQPVWVSAQSYETRVANLLPIIQPGTFLLNNNAVDEIHGGGGRNWFLLSEAEDIIHDLDIDETVTDIG